MNEYSDRYAKHLCYKIEYHFGFNCAINGGMYDEHETGAWKQGYKDGSGITNWQKDKKLPI